MEVWVCDMMNTWNQHRNIVLTHVRDIAQNHHSWNVAAIATAICFTTNIIIFTEPLKEMGVKNTVTIICWQHEQLINNRFLSNDDIELGLMICYSNVMNYKFMKTADHYHHEEW